MSLARPPSCARIPAVLQKTTFDFVLSWVTTLKILPNQNWGTSAPEQKVTSRGFVKTSSSASRMLEMSWTKTFSKFFRNLRRTNQLMIFSPIRFITLTLGKMTSTQYYSEGMILTKFWPHKSLIFHSKNHYDSNVTQNHFDSKCYVQIFIRKSSRTAEQKFICGLSAVHNFVYNSRCQYLCR